MWWTIFAWFLHAEVFICEFLMSLYLGIMKFIVIYYSILSEKNTYNSKEPQWNRQHTPFWHTAPVDADQIIHPLSNRRLKWWINVVWAAHDNLCGRVVVNGSRQINHVYACFTMSTSESTGMQNDQLTTPTTRWMCNSINAGQRGSNRIKSEFWHNLLITYVMHSIYFVIIHISHVLIDN